MADGSWYEISATTKAGISAIASFLETSETEAMGMILEEIFAGSLAKHLAAELLLYIRNITLNSKDFPRNAESFSEIFRRACISFADSLNNSSME